MALSGSGLATYASAGALVFVMLGVGIDRADDKTSRESEDVADVSADDAWGDSQDGCRIC
ncbi:hypothetical protein Rmet_6743 (plasmid) [Cupriavidus metallidurans CH34]|uniref:Uncharacterized protein n=1 Tax=Cupriavidus metallidurans (strain ATCC 43123 / DSM 2839 / NBRC 102507 / CH34) TaxID=266264 RepID=D3DYF2_CUPMC|nr:hypothetical protein Rmet_6743 [Cupriavidus metallidurans CH34]